MLSHLALAVQIITILSFSFIVCGGLGEVSRVGLMVGAGEAVF